MFVCIKKNELLYNALHCCASNCLNLYLMSVNQTSIAYIQRLENPEDYILVYNYYASFTYKLKNVIMYNSLTN